MLVMASGGVLPLRPKPKGKEVNKDSKERRLSNRETRALAGKATGVIAVGAPLHDVIGCLDVFVPAASWGIDEVPRAERASRRATGGARE